MFDYVYIYNKSAYVGTFLPYKEIVISYKCDINIQLKKLNVRKV